MGSLQADDQVASMTDHAHVPHESPASAGLPLAVAQPGACLRGIYFHELVWRRAKESAFWGVRSIRPPRTTCCTTVTYVA